MQILVISNLYPPIYIGGYELACADIVEGLKKRGYNITVLTSNFGVSQCANNREVYRSLNSYFNRTVGYLNRLKRTWVDLYNFKTTLKIINGLKPDIIYAWNLSEISMVSVLLAIRKSKVPLVIHLMDYMLGNVLSLNPSGHNIIERKLKSICYQILNHYLQLNHLIAMSNTVKANYARLGYDPKNITVIYHGINLGSIPESNKNHNQKMFRILYAGQLIENKGIHVALEALAELVHESQLKSIELDVIGPDPDNYQSILIELVRRYKINDFVHFLGQKDREELIKIYYTYDVFVYPTLREEPFGIAIIEAMAAGLPVIASNIGGPAEIITHEKTGLLFPVGNGKKLANAFRILIQDRDLGNKISDNALRLVKNKFNLEVTVNRIEEYLERVCKIID